VMQMEGALGPGGNGLLEHHDAVAGLSAPRSLSENDRPGDTGSRPGGTTMFGVSIANFSSCCRDQNSFDRHGYWSCRLALYCPRVVDTSSSITSLGEGVAVISVTPSEE
jgi:hypothetical protein